MKVVINQQWGGFELSPKATKRLAELKGRKCYFYVHERNNGTLNLDKYVSVTMTQAANEFIWVAFDVTNANEIQGDDWYTKHVINYREIERDDKDLVRVVQELGKDANTKFSELKIVTIPNGVEYEIDDYDGMETIHEKHRSWA